jgi:hypothetical protein
MVQIRMKYIDKRLSSRPQETTAFGRGGMCSRVTGMSPHMGVKQGTTGFARGAPLIGLKIYGKPNLG